jgi:hypothetical protein
VARRSIDRRVVEAIANDYFAPFEVDAPPGDPNLRRSSRAWGRIEGYVDRDPERGFALILALADLAPDQEAVDLLGAGPLEAFVRAFSAAFVDRIDAAARQSAKFRSALSYIRGWDEVAPEVRARLFRHFADFAPDGGPLPVPYAPGPASAVRK